MRRTTIAALACLAAAACPAAALADHGDGRRGEYHAPQSQAAVDVGTVTAFDGRVLTIGFTDGNSVSGTTSVSASGTDDGDGDSPSAAQTTSVTTTTEASTESGTPASSGATELPGESGGGRGRD